jgi:hypothetical protein
MKISKMLGILVVVIAALSVCNLKADETNSPTPPASQTAKFKLNFSGDNTSQVLKVYAALVGVELKQAQPIPTGAINFKAEKLTRSQAIQVLEKILREQGGIVLKPLDAKHVEVEYDQSVKVKN